MRSLMFEYIFKEEEKMSSIKLNIDYGEAEDWIEGDLIQPIPQDRRY